MEWEVGKLRKFEEFEEECRVCGSLIELEDFTYMSVSEDGEREFYCTPCGEEAEDKDEE